MNMTDLITMFGNLSQSLYPAQKIISGGAYLLGILFVLKAIGKFRKIADTRAQSHSQEKMYSPIMYLVMGAILIFLPTFLNVAANTAFGTGNVLTYYEYNKFNIYSTIGLLVRTAGILWFVRGCVLVAHASEPGTQEGPKGMLFILAGILAMNFDNSISVVNTILTGLIKWTMSIKSSQGY